MSAAIPTTATPDVFADPLARLLDGSTGIRPATPGSTFAGGGHTARQGTGTVVDATDARVRVAGGGGLHECRVALGCLLQPIPFDRVAWFEDEGGDRWVLSVLERTSVVPATLALPRDSTITVAGRLTLKAGETMSVQTPELEVAASRARLFAAAADLVGEAVTLVGQAVHASFDRMFSRTRLHQRTVTGLDSVQANAIDYRADTIASVGADTVSLHGQRLTKLRGGQIHMD